MKVYNKLPLETRNWFNQEKEVSNIMNQFLECFQWEPG